MAFDFFENWAEFFFFLILVGGFVIAILSTSAVISYVLIFVCGMIAGRLIYERKKKLVFTYYLVIIGFLVGYLVGVYYGNRSVMITLFVLGGIVSYYVYEKGLLHDIRY